MSSATCVSPPVSPFASLTEAFIPDPSPPYLAINAELICALKNDKSKERIASILEKLPEEELTRILWEFSDDRVKVEAFHQWRKISTPKGVTKIQEQINRYPEKDWCGVSAAISLGDSEAIAWMFFHFDISAHITMRAVRNGGSREKFAVLSAVVLSQNRWLCRQIWEELTEQEQLSVLTLACRNVDHDVINKILFLSNLKISQSFLGVIQQAISKRPEKSWCGLIDCIIKQRYDDLVWRLETFSPSFAEQYEALEYTFTHSSPQVQKMIWSRMSPLKLVEWAVQHQRPTLSAFVLKCFQLDAALVAALQKACDSNPQKDWCGLINCVKYHNTSLLQAIFNNIRISPGISYQAFKASMPFPLLVSSYFLSCEKRMLEILQESERNKDKELIFYLISRLTLTPKIHGFIQEVYDRNPKEDWCGLLHAINIGDERLWERILNEFNHPKEILDQMFLSIIAKEFPSKGDRHISILEQIMPKIAPSKEIILQALRVVFLQKGSIGVTKLLFKSDNAPNTLDWIDFAIQANDTPFLFSMVTCKNVTFSYGGRLKIQEHCDKMTNCKEWQALARQLRFRWKRDELEEMQKAYAQPGDLGLTLADPDAYQEWSFAK